MSTRIAIIGAGNSGICAFNACKEQQLSATCFERSSQICGMWRFREEVEEGMASIYRSTTINTSKEMTSFSSFPAPEHFPNYMHNELMSKYIEMFADHVGFKEHVLLNHEVVSVVQSEDYHVTGRWKLTIRKLETGSEFEETFDGVMVCSGHNNKPFWPQIKGLEKYNGKLLHSHDYKGEEEMRDKRVLVVGIGNSAGDIAVEASHVAKQVYLSTRSGSWVSHRVGHRGRPFDAMLLRRSWNLLFRVTPFPLSCHVAEWYLNTRFDHKLYGLKPKHRIFSQHIFVNDDLPKKVISGSIQIKPDVETFTGSGIVFEGEKAETEVDFVILCTGYQLNYPFLEKSGVHVTKKDFDLYKLMFPPSLPRPSLAFIGLVLPIGAVLPLAELQSRWFALLMRGKRQLPSEPEMRKWVLKRRKWVRRHFPNWEKHALEVYWVPMMDSYAREVKCKPNLVKYFFFDPKLWSKLFFGPLVPYQYRLTGPNEWSGAREAILTVNQRIEAPFKTRITKK